MTTRALLLGIGLLMGVTAVAETNQRLPVDPEHRFREANVLADFALCRNGMKGPYSKNDRQRFLGESVQILEALISGGLNLSFESAARAELARLRFFQEREQQDAHFWNSGSTCPRHLHFPVAALGPTESLQDGIQRATSYARIALCDGVRGPFSIADRVENLDASLQLFRLLVAENEEPFRSQAAASIEQLEPLLAPAQNHDFWDVKTTCPR